MWVWFHINVLIPIAKWQACDISSKKVDQMKITKDGTFTPLNFNLRNILRMAVVLEHLMPLIQLKVKRLGLKKSLNKPQPTEGQACVGIARTRQNPWLSMPSVHTPLSSLSFHQTQLPVQRPSSFTGLIRSSSTDIYPKPALMQQWIWIYHLFSHFRASLPRVN